MNSSNNKLERFLYMTFKMWSLGHILFILSSFILTVILYYLTKKIKKLIG